MPSCGTAFRARGARSAWAERSWGEVTTRYGRRHQVRVQLAAAGAPIVGDPLYGPESDAPRLALHAQGVIWEDWRMEAPLTADLVDYFGGWVP